MKRQDKNLFDKRFNIFWERLTKKKKMNDEQKNHYQKTMLNHFKELRKNLDEHTSLFYVFNIPFSIIIFNEKNQLRTKGYSEKYFLQVIDYYLERRKALDNVDVWKMMKDYNRGKITKDEFKELTKEITEYAACKYVKEKEHIGAKVDKLVRKKAL